MKKYICSFVVTITLLCASITIFGATVFPKPVGLVNDFANVLSSAEKNGLESKLSDYREKTNIEFKVVTIPSLGDMSVEEYANKLFKEWGIGKKGKDNGVLLLFAPNELPRGKVRIEVGYGLEEYLTDGESGEIIRNSIVPGWRSAHRADGVLGGVIAIIAKLDESTKLSVTTPLTRNNSHSIMTFVPFFIMGAFIVALLIWVVASGVKEDRKARKEAALPESPLKKRTVHPFHPHVDKITRRNEQEEVSRIRDDEDDERSSPVSSDFSFSGSSDSGSDFGGGSSGGGGASGDL